MKWKESCSKTEDDNQSDTDPCWLRTALPIKGQFVNVLLWNTGTFSIMLPCYVQLGLVVDK